MRFGGERFFFFLPMTNVKQIKNTIYLKKTNLCSVSNI